MAPSNLADNYHVYGLEWDKERIKWYFDGVLVRWVDNTHWHQPLTLNFDSETMPKWFGLPKDSDLPSTYSIEYVRAWKKETVGESRFGATFEIYPATVDSQEEFETIANSLKPGDELLLHEGLYSQSARRAVTAKGSAHTGTSSVIMSFTILISAGDIRAFSYMVVAKGPTSLRVTSSEMLERASRWFPMRLLEITSFSIVR